MIISEAEIDAQKDYKFDEEIFVLVQNRLSRLNRLIELNAPQLIICNEYQWFKIEVDRAHKIIRGLDAPYTQEQIEELKELHLIDSIFDEEEDNDN